MPTYENNLFSHLSLLRGPPAKSLTLLYSYPLLPHSLLILSTTPSSLPHPYSWAAVGLGAVGTGNSWIEEQHRRARETATSSGRRRLAWEQHLWAVAATSNCSRLESGGGLDDRRSRSNNGDSGGCSELGQRRARPPTTRIPPSLLSLPIILFNPGNQRSQSSRSVGCWSGHGGSTSGRWWQWLQRVRVVPGSRGGVDPSATDPAMADPPATMAFEQWWRRRQRQTTSRVRVRVLGFSDFHFYIFSFSGANGLSACMGIRLHWPHPKIRFSHTFGHIRPSVYMRKSILATWKNEICTSVFCARKLNNGGVLFSRKMCGLFTLFWKLSYFFSISTQRAKLVNEMGIQGKWELNFRRHLDDRNRGQLERLLGRIGRTELTKYIKMKWYGIKEKKGGVEYTVISMYIYKNNNYAEKKFSSKNKTFSVYGL